MIQKREIIPLILIFLIILVLFNILIDKRPFTDEGSFCTIAQAISNGAILYRDIYNEKAPLPYLFASIFIDYSENPIRVLRVISIILFFTSVILMYLYLRPHGFTIYQRTIILLFFVFTAPLFQSFNYTAEIVGLPLIVFIVHQIKRYSSSQKSEEEINIEQDLMTAKGGDKIHIITGIFAGLLFFIKQPFILFVVIIFIIAATDSKMRRYFITGFFSAIILVLLLMLLTGTLLPFIENLLFTMKRYDLESYIRLPYPNEYYQFILLGILFFEIIVFLYYKSLRFSDFIIILSLLLPGMIRMDAFKFLPALAVILLFLTNNPYFKKLRNRVVLIGVFSLFSILHYTDILSQDFDSIKMVSTAVQVKSSPKDSIWVGPHEANIYCLSHRRPASKYFFLLPWINKPEVLITLGEDLVKRDPPVCIVDVSKFNMATTYRLEDMIPEFPEIIRDYKDRQEISGAVIYCKE